jgi:hypothetical protein
VVFCFATLKAEAKIKKWELIPTFLLLKSRRTSARVVAVQSSLNFSALLPPKYYLSNHLMNHDPFIATYKRKNCSGEN